MEKFNLLEQIKIRSVERDFALEELQSSKEKLELALNGGEIGIWEWDLLTDKIIWDARMEKMFGLEEGSFEQSYDAFKACLHPDDVVPTAKIFNEAIELNANVDKVYRVVWKNKKIKYIRAKAVISKNLEGKALKMMGVCFDVSEIKKAEAMLKEHSGQLEKLVTERTRELQEKNKDLENMNEVFVGREFRIKELKEKVKVLKDKEIKS